MNKMVAPMQTQSTSPRVRQVPSFWRGGIYTKRGKAFWAPYQATIHQPERPEPQKGSFTGLWHISRGLWLPMRGIRATGTLFGSFREPESEPTGPAKNRKHATRPTSARRQRHGQAASKGPARKKATPGLDRSAHGSIEYLFAVILQCSPCLLYHFQQDYTGIIGITELGHHAFKAPKRGYLNKGPP